MFESVSNLNQGRSLELNVLLGSEPTTTQTTVVNSSGSGASSTTTRIASPTREVMKDVKLELEDRAAKPHFVRPRLMKVTHSEWKLMFHEKKD